MFNLFRKRSTAATSPADSSSIAEPVYAPQVHQFCSIQRWLYAWVSFRMCELKSEGRTAYEINGQSMIPLLGSIGLDSAIAVDGTFWIWLEELDAPEELNTWRVATLSERTWLTVCAQRRCFPEFSVLLPLKPVGVIACKTCAGTGFVFRNSTICFECSALGWLSADLIQQ